MQRDLGGTSRRQFRKGGREVTSLYVTLERDRKHMKEPGSQICREGTFQNKGIDP